MICGPPHVPFKNKEGGNTIKGPGTRTLYNIRPRTIPGLVQRRKGKERLRGPGRSKGVPKVEKLKKKQGESEAGLRRLLRGETAVSTSSPRATVEVRVQNALRAFLNQQFEEGKKTS